MDLMISTYRCQFYYTKIDITRWYDFIFIIQKSNYLQQQHKKKSQIIIYRHTKKKCTISSNYFNIGGS